MASCSGSKIFCHRLMPGRKRSTSAACFLMSWNLRSMNCPMSSVKYSSLTNWRDAASKSCRRKVVLTQTPCFRASATRCFICASVCRAFTTSLRTSEGNRNMKERLMRMTKLTRLMILAPLAILGMVVFTAIGGGLVMLLWNGLAPTLFGLRLVTFWQAIGLLALCRILFGGFGLGGGGHRNSRRRMDGRIRERMRERMAERWGQTTPEEREKFRQGTRSCGGGQTVEVAFSPTATN